MMIQKKIVGLLTFLLVLSLSACAGNADVGETASTQGANLTESAQEGTVGDLSPEMEAVIQTVNAETAKAAGVCGPDLVWYYKDGVLVISGTGEMNNFDYASDAPWSEFRETINLVYLAPGVTRVGAHAFAYMEQLSRVVLTDTLEEVGKAACRDCTSLKEVVIPASVHKVGRSAFSSESVIFLGDAPEYTIESDLRIVEGSCTVTYYGEGFEPYVEYYATEDSIFNDVTWVKG